MRLFVAIELVEQVQSMLGDVQSALKRSCDGVRWIRPALVHLTVKFLGEIPDGDVNHAAQAVARAAVDATPFTMRLAGCGCFPPRGAVRIVWAGVEEASGALLQCVEAVEAQLESCGFPKERKPFSPHITIGRVREDRSAGRIRSAIEVHTLGPAQQPVSSITLMSSVLSPKGPTYTPVNVTNLGPAKC